MLDRLKISQKGLIVVIALLTIEIAFVLFLTFELQNTRQRLAAEQRSRAIAEHLNRFACQSQRAGFEMLQSTMVPKDARNIVGWGDHRKFIDLMKSELRSLEELLQNDREAVLKLAAMRDGVEAFSNTFENSLHLVKASRKKRSRGEGQYMTRFDMKSNSQLDLMNAVKEMKKQCNQLMDQYCKTKPGTLTELASEETLESLKTALIISATGSFAVLLGIALWFFSTVAGRVLFIANNARRFAQGEQLAPRLTGSDELAQLDSALHDMVRDLSAAIAQDQGLLKFASDAICVVDSRNNFVDVNPAVITQWGYAPEELLGKNIDLVLPATDFAALTYGKLDKVAEESHAVSQQKLTQKNGEIIDVLLSIYWSPIEGNYFCSIRDITDAKRIEDLLAVQEEQVRNVIENLPAGIVTLEADRIVSSNESFRQLCGMEKNKLLGMSIDKLVRPDDADGARASISQSLYESPSGETSIRSLMEDSTGSTRYLDVTAVKNLGDADSTLLVTIEDITERRRLEELKRSFVAVLGDDIREPLKEIGEIVGDLNSKVDSNSKLHPRLSRSELTVSRLLNLTSELLKVEEMTDEVLLSGMAPCSVPDLISEAVDAIKDYAELQGIEIEAETDQSTVLADRLRLLQVIINLGSNAIKYSPKGSRVSILVLRTDGKVRLEVKDRGRGIPATMHDSIFQPFVQSRKEDARYGVGTGLGLSICKKIVEAHKGKIGVISTEGEGSTFWIDLPQVASS